MEQAPQRMKADYLYINTFKANLHRINLKFLLDEECRCLFTIKTSSENIYLV